MDRHNQWLKQGFDDSVFIMAGSIAQAQGGMIMANNISLSDLQVRVGEDPFVVEDIVTVELIEIEPKKVAKPLDFLMD